MHARPTHLSASALQDFVDCPRKFRLQRLEKITPSFRPVALPTGSAWHSTVSRALFEHGQGRGLNRSDLKSHFAKELHRELRKDGPPVLLEDDETEADIAAAGGRMIDAFLDRVPMPDRVLGIEVAFSVEAHDPETGESLGVPIIGALDAIVEENGRSVLLEFKSGKRRWPEDKVANDLQASCYRIGAKSRGIADPEQRLVLTTKGPRPQVQVERLIRTNRDELEVMDTVANVLRAVDTGVDHRVRSWRCGSCPVAGACR